MDDLISRQAAIDLINVRLSQPCKNHTSEFVQGMEDGYCRIRSDIKCLPSAQPQITYCAECIHWKHSDVRKNCCEVFDWINTAEDFCSFAERRSDG